MFRTEDGLSVPALTAAQMREVDRIAVDEFGLGILQMMENAGRNLAENVMAMLGGARGEVAVLAGPGGNGGGGLCCARHLHNRGLAVSVVLSREATALTGPARHQLRTLMAAGVQPLAPSHARDAIRRAELVVDALIGYSLRGAPRGRVAELIELCNQHAAQVLSLDVPSGLDATTRETPGRRCAPRARSPWPCPRPGFSARPATSTWPTSASRPPFSSGSESPTHLSLETATGCS